MVRLGRDEGGRCTSLDTDPTDNDGAGRAVGKGTVAASPYTVYIFVDGNCPFGKGSRAYCEGEPLGRGPEGPWRRPGIHPLAAPR